MKPIFVAVGIVSLAFAGSALSKPGNGHGNGHQNGYGYVGYGNAYGRQGPVGYGVGGCPPGLAKKNNGCMPPGQARKLLGGRGLSYGLVTRHGHRHSLRPHSHRLKI
jgi:hypothetical protein